MVIDKNKQQIVEVTDERLNVLQQMSSDFHRIYGEAMREYGEKELKLIDDTLGFGYKLIQVIGVVAGFGFTALGSVKTVIFFIFGELLFIGSIIYGVYQIKRIYATNLETIQKSSNQKNKVFREKSQLFQDVIGKAVKERKIDVVYFQQKLDVVDTKLVSEFSDEPIKSTKNEGKFLDTIVLFLTFGSLFLLTSFLDFSSINLSALIGLWKK
ncbi:MAG: hypothetical protein M1366_05585 [Patescibacteria group bacterium]|nr:hypothetical protein [Patescibacteria group bacterium]